MWKSLIFVSFCVVAVQLRAEPEVKGTPAELSAYLPNVSMLASITGESEVKIPADRALISLKVVTENKSLQEASRANQDIRGKMLRTLGEQGIPTDRIKPSKFSSTPKYGMFGEKAKSYRVENVVRITATDEKEFRAVANLVDSISEVRYDSIEFEHSNKDELKAKALAQALDKANDKKRVYEEKLGVKLTPKGFTEGHVVMPVAALGRPYITKESSYSSRAATPLPAMATGDTGDAEVPTSFGELIYRGNVTVEFVVESK